MISLNDFSTVKKYLDRIGAEPRSIRKAVVREEIGKYWLDVCIINFSKTGDVTVSDERFIPTEIELQVIKEELSSVKWPEAVFIKDLNDANLPAMVKGAVPEDIFAFRDVNNNITMLQVRKERKGERSYIPVTLFDDGEYRFCEPDGSLPLFGLENLKNNTTVFVHEGAKAARHAQEIANGSVSHPWSQELAHACHVGFCGGALSPERTDWKILKKHGVTRVIIVPDNDLVGLSAVPKISRQLDCVTMMIQFTDDWPKSADLYDPFPEKLFRKIGDLKYYIGPSFQQCLHPATYMTHLIPIPDSKKMLPVLRHHAVGQWLYVEESELFVNVENPEIIRKADSLDAMLRPFSDTKKTSELILKSFTGRVTNLAYDPRSNGRKVMIDGNTAINLYQPSDIKPQSGDPQPWLDFVSNLVPDEDEKKNVLKWTATLIAKPERHIQFALLMISEQTGTGKSAFARILARCVGMHNTSFPSEKQILDTFTGWIARKRLVVINEVYSGSNWKMANAIKSYITDEDIALRMMFKEAITIKNFAHFVANSNSPAAIKIDEKDRRWYIPTITEERWSDEKFNEFFQWLESGGYSIIIDWANRYGEYFNHGSKAPMTERKKDMIADSRSKEQNEAVGLANLMNESEEPISIGYRDIKIWLELMCNRALYDSDVEIKRSMRDAGVFFSKGRVSLDGRMQALCMNAAMTEKIIGITIFLF